ncbi:serine palmitoyltransferase 2-like protein, partial [Dinothrombium tinctorium]
NAFLFISNKGRERVQRLAENTAYLRAKLKQMGFIVIGDDDSPVVPVKIGLGSKMSALARFARDRGLAAAVVGFPATYLSECRLRLCVSASLTRETLDKIIDILSRIGDEIGIKYAL